MDEETKKKIFLFHLLDVRLLNCIKYKNLTTVFHAYIFQRKRIFPVFLTLKFVSTKNFVEFFPLFLLMTLIDSFLIINSSENFCRALTSIF